ncbi:MAG: DEAD/DEAH box helicase [Deltaproteobacteria bacterium]|jgi:ATP-dependent RNA helicase RhlB|nr:DEAD/DEAH box helicase [Deltaproteobacteria bacterium]
MFSKTPGGDIPPEGVKASDGAQERDSHSAEGEQSRQNNHERQDSEDLKTPARSDPAQVDSVPAQNSTPSPKPNDPEKAPRRDYWGQFGYGIKTKPAAQAQDQSESTLQAAPEPEAPAQDPEVSLAQNLADQDRSDQALSEQDRSELAPSEPMASSPDNQPLAGASGSPALDDLSPIDESAKEAKKAPVSKPAKGLAYSSFGPVIKPQKPKIKDQAVPAPAVEPIIGHGLPPRETASVAQDQGPVPVSQESLEPSGEKSDQGPVTGTFSPLGAKAKPTSEPLYDESAVSHAEESILKSFFESPAGTSSNQSPAGPGKAESLSEAASLEKPAAELLSNQVAKSALDDESELKVLLDELAPARGEVPSDLSPLLDSSKLGLADAQSKAPADNLSQKAIDEPESKGLLEKSESVTLEAMGQEFFAESPSQSSEKPEFGALSPESTQEGLKLDTLKRETLTEPILDDLLSSDSPAEKIFDQTEEPVTNLDSPKARINLSGLGPTEFEQRAGGLSQATSPDEPESLAMVSPSPTAPAALAAEDPDLRAGRPNFLTSTRFSDFDLPQEIMLGIEAAGFDCTTPIQAQVIPVALEGLDIAGQAQTGTGKTTAFLVPLLSRLIRKPAVSPGLPRALVITPTRELADQIYKDAKVLTSATNISLALVMGGLEYREQSNVLQDGADLVICTPGRLIDYLHQGIFVPSAVEVAVVDEADRLLDMGFIKDLMTILSKLPPYTQRQTMLFSATLDDRVLELTYQYMNPPQYITAEPDPQSKIQIDQTLYHVSNSEKLPLLIGLLRHQEHSRVIIFCNTRNRVDWLTKKLTLNGFQAEGITGDLPQPKRLKLMQAFKDQRLQIMVATDVASRGIHVEDVSHVYNYDLPQDSENYIHRIGRTARAGKTGKAISFACEEHVYHLEAIENLLGEKIPVVWPDEALFDKDRGGEVKFREREKPRDRDSRADRGDRERASSRSFRPPSSSFQDRTERRGPVQINRPGGIFGISPRYPIQNGTVDVRQALTWKPSEFTAEDIKLSRARSAKASRQGPYSHNGSPYDSAYASSYPHEPEPRPEAKRSDLTPEPYPYEPDNEPPLYFDYEPQPLDLSNDERSYANDRDNRRKKRLRGKFGRDFEGPENGYHDPALPSSKKSDRRAQKEALRKTLIDDELEPEIPFQAQTQAQPLDGPKKPPFPAPRQEKRPNRPAQAHGEDRPEARPESRSEGRPDTRPETGPLAKAQAKAQVQPKAQAAEAIDCQVAAEQEYLDSGLVEEHPNLALAASEELTALDNQASQRPSPAKAEPQAPAAAASEEV